MMTQNYLNELTHSILKKDRKQWELNFMQHCQKDTNVIYCAYCG